MKTSMKAFLVVAVISLFIILALAAPQMSQETAKDPVCNMAVKKADATITAEYQGKTYYFCSQTCKEAFLKDPAKFAAMKNAQAGDAKDKESAWMGCCGHGRGAMKGMMKMPSAMMGNCPMMRRHVAMMHGMSEGCGRRGWGMSANMNLSVENTDDGVVVKITSKDAETVKMIQEQWARRKAAGASSPCTKPKTEDVKKEAPDNK